MKRIVQAAAWLACILLLALSPFLAALLPLSREELVQRSFASWSGVLRIWKCEGWQSGSGSLTSWLNSCVAAFEKSHPGVYIQITDVSSETLRSFASDKFNPPDALFFAPGLLDSPANLLPLSASASVKPALREAGCYQDVPYALPIAMGGYALAINNRTLPKTPDNWRNADSEKALLLHCAEDSDYLSWSAALMALFAGSSSSSQENSPVGEGISLGLPDIAPSPSPTPTRTEYHANALPSVLPDHFRQEKSVYQSFTTGKVAAIPVTQREIARLTTLSESGKGPDWRIETIGLPFTDQLTFFSVTDCSGEDTADRQALLQDFLELLLSEKMQRKLSSVRAFPVCSVSGLYTAPGLAALEQVLSSGILLVPPAFGRSWRDTASSLADALAPSSSTFNSFRALKEALNPDT